MKLNLTQDQARLAAAAAGVAFDAQNQWRSLDLACRGMRTIGHTEISKRDVWYVCMAMGAQGDIRSVPEITDSRGTKLWSTGNGYFGQKGFPKVRKGVYDISKLDPIQVSGAPSQEPQPGPFSPPSSQDSGPMPTLQLKVISVPGVDWAPTTEASPTNESWYADDAALRRMALESTPCFGSFSASAKACAACPLARFCAQNSADSLGDLAAELDAATTKKITEAELKVKLSSQAPQKAAPEPKKAAPGDVTWPSNIKPLKGSPALDVVCSGCGEKIPAGTPNLMHATGVPGLRSGGLYHFDCAKKTL